MHGCRVGAATLACPPSIIAAADVRAGAIIAEANARVDELRAAATAPAEHAAASARAGEPVAAAAARAHESEARDADAEPLTSATAARAGGVVRPHAGGAAAPSTASRRPSGAKRAQNCAQNWAAATTGILYKRIAALEGEIAALTAALAAATVPTELLNFCI